MKLGADPQTTYAVLVGVETYAGGAAWDLDGPATGALRMAQWLLDQHVPPAHIALFVNFGQPRSDAGRDTLQVLRESMTRHGLVMREPSRALLEAALSPASLPGSPEQNATLIVYFTGHGLSSEVKRQRFALTQDAGEEAHHAIDLEYQATSLRLNPRAKRFATQWFIQDACAQTANRVIRPVAVHSELPDEPQGTRQYCLYATQPGEFALTEEGRAGEFSWQLLDVLQHAGPLATLDLKNVYGELARRFSSLEQHPVLYSRDENWAVTTLAPGAKAQSAAIEALCAALGQMQVSLKMLHAVFQDVAQSEETPPGGFDDMLHRLESLVMDQSTGLQAVERFALRLESYCLRYAAGGAGASDAQEAKKYASAAKLAKKWIDQWPKKRASAAVQQERKRLAAAARVAQKSPVIILELQRDAQARAWRYGNGEALEACLLELGGTTLAGQVAQALGTLCAKQWLLDETLVELVLPLEMVLQHFTDIDVVVDAVNNLTYKLGGRQLLLVVRVAERWSDRTWQTRWTDYWRETADFRLGKPQLIWLDSGAMSDRSGWFWLGASDIDSAELKTALRKALYEGLPFAAWCDAQHMACLESALTGHTYADIFKLLQGVGTLNGAGRRLTCLIDDPDRIPPGADPATGRLRQPTVRIHS